MIGHGRPLFLRFKRGGKMVATCGGAFLGVAPLIGDQANVARLLAGTENRFRFRRAAVTR
jgi:hypothetical protein